MQWDPVAVTYNSEPFYFGPLSGYDTEKLDKKGLDQDKKNSKGFKWLSKKESMGDNVEKKAPVNSWDDPPPTPEQGQKQSQSLKPDPDGAPSWDEFTQTTTFHGVRYIFDKSPNKLRR